MNKKFVSFYGSVAVEETCSDRRLKLLCRICDVYSNLFLFSRWDSSGGPCKYTHSVMLDYSSIGSGRGLWVGPRDEGSCYAGMLVISSDRIQHRPYEYGRQQGRLEEALPWLLLSTDYSLLLQNSKRYPVSVVLYISVIIMLTILLGPLLFDSFQNYFYYYRLQYYCLNLHKIF